MTEETTEPPKIGRPSEYTQEKADAICAMIAEGKSIRTICAIDEMPGTPTFYKWLRTYPEFLQQYACAKQDQADAMVEEMLEIADDGTNDYMEIQTKKGVKVVFDKEHAARSRLRVETRKWLASKLKPKAYGMDAVIVQQQQLDKDGKTIDPVGTNVTDLVNAAMAKVEQQRES